MLVAFILIVIFILLGIMSAIYSVFSPFIESIGNVVNFNSAYYGALGGVERAELVLKYKEPGFEGSGGFLSNTTFGPKSDIITGNFGRFTNSIQNGFSWAITSRSTSIPSSGNGNVDYLLSSSDSSNYNKLPYFYSDKLVLSLDNTTNPNNYYTGTTGLTYFNGGSFSGILRLPPKISGVFGSDSKLCTDSNIAACDPDGDSIFDDTSVNRGLDGMVGGSPFTILPNISVFYYSGMQIDTKQDIAIRESILNNTGKLFFGGTFPDQKFNPIANYNLNNLTQHNVISVNPNAIQNSGYNTILSNPNITGLEFSINIVDLLRTRNNNIYPFLEYQLSFPQPVADRFYTIQGVGLVGDYNVKIFIKKSTNESSSIGDFTIIF